MIGALAREVRNGDWAACGTLSPMPAAALWLAKLTHATRAEVLVAGSRDWPFADQWQGFFDLAQAGRLNGSNNSKIPHHRWERTASASLPLP